MHHWFYIFAYFYGVWDLGDSDLCISTINQPSSLLRRLYHISFYLIFILGQLLILQCFLLILKLFSVFIIILWSWWTSRNVNRFTSLLGNRCLILRKYNVPFTTLRLAFFCFGHDFFHIVSYWCTQAHFWFSRHWSFFVILISMKMTFHLRRHYNLFHVIYLSRYPRCLINDIILLFLQISAKLLDLLLHLGYLRTGQHRVRGSLLLRSYLFPTLWYESFELPPAFLTRALLLKCSLRSVVQTYIVVFYLGLGLVVYHTLSMYSLS